jgi:hypothetical protein
MIRRFFIAALVFLGVFLIAHATGPWIARAMAHPVEQALDEVVNARVYAVLDSLGLLNLPSPPDPPPPPPPPPTEPPPPTPSGELEGGSALSGAWAGWRGRHPMGEKFASGPGGEMVMGSNTLAVRDISVGARGFVEFDVRYETDTHPCCGGQHLFSVTSQTACQGGPCIPALGCPEDPLCGWVRMDHGVRTGEIVSTLYNPGSARNGATHTLVAWKQWAHVRQEWDQTAGRLVETVNGKRSEWTLPLDSHRTGRLLVFGNMDRYPEGEPRCGGPGPCGTTGKVWYKNLRFGPR